ncbi:hypothetical protein ACDY97_25580 [Rhizobium mongolense]|uniref:maleate cis-trans isomerase family protein n=1 Tax=Rhizobium mongolense TaxID=57676 RepID=UPI0035564913
MNSSTITHMEAQLDGGMSEQIVIGLIALSTDVVTEYELRKMLPSDGVSISATRIKTQNPLTIENLRGHAHEIAEAADLFIPRESVNVFAYGCTSGSALISQNVLEAELHRTVPGAKLTSPMTGAYKAFTQLGITKISMLTPYPDEVTEAMIDCLAQAGITVVSCGSFHIENDYEIINVTPESIIAAGEAINSADVEALFIPCTGLRTSTVIDSLEARIGKPVITAHQAMLWDALRLAGYPQPLSGFGKLFTV